MRYATTAPCAACGEIGTHARDCAWLTQLAQTIGLSPETLWLAYRLQACTPMEQHAIRRLLGLFTEDDDE